MPLNGRSSAKVKIFLKLPNFLLKKYLPAPASFPKTFVYLQRQRGEVNI
jgi:hypothetical protein